MAPISASRKLGISVQIEKLKKYLKWYFCDSAVVLGQRSNYYTILNTAYGSAPAVDNEGLLGSLKKIAQHRRLWQAMTSIPQYQVRQLSALYLDEYQNRYPLIIKRVFNEKTGLALCLSYDLEELLQLCMKHRHENLTAPEKAALDKLIRLTDETYDKLHKQLQYNQYLATLK
jgi:hypothetical protein